MSISSNGYSKNGFDGMFGDLKAQEASSLDRRVEPASPEEFIKWARQTLRNQRAIYDNLFKEHAILSRSADIATVGLGRLGSLVKFGNRAQYETIVDLHRNFTFKNKNIGFSLQKCKNSIDDTIMNIQFVGETLAAPLADRHKKIAAQKEMGLRLKDTETAFDRCKAAVNSQKKINSQLSEGIQALMHKSSISLPDQVKETINREDRVKKLAITHRKSLDKGRDVINTTPYIPKERTTVELGGWGDAQQPTTPTTIADPAETPKATAKEMASGFNPCLGLASTTVGIIVGILIFYVILGKK
jgi:hypothetical protein